MKKYFNIKNALRGLIFGDLGLIVFIAAREVQGYIICPPRTLCPMVYTPPYAGYILAPIALLLPLIIIGKKEGIKNTLAVAFFEILFIALVFAVDFILK